MEALVGFEFSKGTAERYRTSLKHTVDFLQWKYNISDIDIRKVDHAFITEYDLPHSIVADCGYTIKSVSAYRMCLNSGLMLPVLSNQKMNSYLKEIADFCGINKPLHSNLQGIPLLQQLRY